MLTGGKLLVGGGIACAIGLSILIASIFAKPETKGDYAVEVIGVVLLAGGLLVALAGVVLIVAGS